jgi:hypothetical protein
MFFPFDAFQLRYESNGVVVWDAFAPDRLKTYC